jgi:hypothetical protein
MIYNLCINKQLYTQNSATQIAGEIIPDKSQSFLKQFKMQRNHTLALKRFKKVSSLYERLKRVALFLINIQYCICLFEFWGEVGEPTQWPTPPSSNSEFADLHRAVPSEIRTECREFPNFNFF